MASSLKPVCTVSGSHIDQHLLTTPVLCGRKLEMRLFQPTGLKTRHSESTKRVPCARMKPEGNGGSAAAAAGASGTASCDDAMQHWTVQSQEKCLLLCIVSNAITAIFHALKQP